MSMMMLLTNAIDWPIDGGFCSIYDIADYGSLLKSFFLYSFTRFYF